MRNIRRKVIHPLLLLGILAPALPASAERHPELPPAERLTTDAHTLFHLDFEEPPDPDAFIMQGDLTIRDDGPEGIGGRRSLLFGPTAHLATAPVGRVNPAAGTIELWFNLHSPGNDRVSRSLVSIGGPHGYEGLYLGKCRYGHVWFRFIRNYRIIARAQACCYARRWQEADVWRHVAASWDAEMMQLFVDGKLVAWQKNPELPRILGPIMHIGSPAIQIADLRISSVVRYRLPVPE